jgi:hypothetical protein
MSTEPRCPVCRGHHDGGTAHNPTYPSRYDLLDDDPRFGLSRGDVLVCESMHWAWADEKVAVLYRESDGHEPGCSQYRSHVRHLSGPRS